MAMSAIRMDENDFIEEVAGLYSGRKERANYLRMLAMKLERWAC